MHTRSDTQAHTQTHMHITQNWPASTAGGHRSGSIKWDSIKSIILYDYCTCAYTNLVYAYSIHEYVRIMLYRLFELDCSYYLWNICCAVSGCFIMCGRTNITLNVCACALYLETLARSRIFSDIFAYIHVNKLSYFYKFSDTNPIKNYTSYFSSN